MELKLMELELMELKLMELELAEFNWNFTSLTSCQWSGH